MQVERLLQISTATLTALGTLLLGMGERNLTLPVLAVIVAASSVYLTDVKEWLQLNTMGSNAAGLVALAVTWHDWEGYESDTQLLAMTNLLIYLQFVLLYRRKNVRNYWLLALLSLMQVAVASALNLNIVFGLLLTAYLFVGLIALSLFYLHREQERFQPRAESERVDRPGVKTPAPANGGPRRWPLGAAVAQVSRRQTAGAADAGLTWGFVRRIVLVGALSVGFALVVFLGVPRAGKSAHWGPRETIEQRSVGFSENMTLGELGQLFENDTNVMTVRFYDRSTKEPYRIAGAPLLRGALLYKYENGEWRRGKGSRTPQLWLPMLESELPKEEEWVRQVITVASRRDDQVLFCVVPSFKTVFNDHLQHSQSSEQIFRGQHFGTHNPFEYELWTPAFRDHMQLLAVPATRELSADKNVDDLLQLPPAVDGIDPLVGLRAIARQRTGDFLPRERLAKAQVLSEYLRNSGEFRYSLKEVKRERNLDPIEDFVNLHKSGNCEYFATALALMLRSVNIPARMAVGFKGGEWNTAGKYYEFQELHTHTWVEVFIPPSMLPNQLADSGLAGKYGAWLQLDPTSASGDLDNVDELGLLNFRRLTDLTQYLWSNYILGMDSKRQKESIYEPLVEEVEDLFRGFANADYWRERWDKLRDFLSAGGGTPADGWLSWQGLLLAVVWLVAATVVYRGVKLAARLALWLLGRRATAKRRRSSTRVEFYERFEALLARHGLQRPECQTQHEFAVVAGGQLAETPGMHDASLLPRRIADAFYRVRFGRIDLDKSDLQAIEQALAELAAALDGSTTRKRLEPVRTTAKNHGSHG